MATTYLSGLPVSSSGQQSSEDEPSGGGSSSSGTSSGGLDGRVMNLVNGNQGYASPARSLAEMHETKYLPPQHQPLHNGHPALAGHNPWGLPEASHWAASAAAMHPAALYPQDLKQDIKPPADFGRVSAAAAHHMHWNPPPVSSPYLGMSAAAAAAGSVSGSGGSSGGSGGGGGGGHNSPSPLQHHPAYGMGGMIPGQIPGHPFAAVTAGGGGPGGAAGAPVGVPGAANLVDRYRDSHNSSPRSGTDEDGMQTPTSGTSSVSSFFPESSGTKISTLP